MMRKAKDPGDDFCLEIRETKQTWLTLSYFRAYQALATVIVAEIQQTNPSGHALLRRIHPTLTSHLHPMFLRQTDFPAR